MFGSSWSFSPIRTVQTAWCSKNGCCICTARKSSHLQAMQRAFQYRSPVTSSIRDCFVGFLVGSYPCQAAKLVIIEVSTWVYWVYGLPIILAALDYYWFAGLITHYGFIWFAREEFTGTRRPKNPNWAVHRWQWSLPLTTRMATNYFKHWKNQLMNHPLLEWWE